MSSAVSRRSRLLGHMTAQIEQLEVRIMLQGLPNPPVTPPTPVQGNEPLQGVVGTPLSLSPAMMEQEWGINQIFYNVGGTVEQADGAGQTIAIIDAYGSPSIVNDVEQFDNYWGLTDSDSSGNFFLSVTALAKTANSESDSAAVIASWNVETSLDVEWAHVIAPEAHIVLVEAPSQSLLDLADANVYATALPGVTVVSNSWGIPVGDIEEPDRFDGFFANPQAKINDNQNVVEIASTGDTSTLEYPSASNRVIGIGGMNFDVDLSGNIIDLGDWDMSGGGPDTIYVPPIYNVPAVSADADPLTGVWVYDSSPNVSLDGVNTIDNAWIYEVGGTSLAAPMWAGYVATIDQGLVMQGQPTLDSPTLMTDIEIAGEGSPNYFENLNPKMPTAYPLWPTNGPIPDAVDIPGNGNTGFGFPNTFNFTSLIETNTRTGNPALEFLEAETKWLGDPTYNGVVSEGNTLDRIRFTSTLADETAGQAIPTFTVDVENSVNALDTGFNGNVTISLFSGGTLSGTLTVTANMGVATFSNISISKVANNYIIEATAANVISGESNPFDVVPAAAASMAITSQPTSIWQYNATTPVALTLEDVFGNIATNNNSDVGVSVAAGPGTFSGAAIAPVIDGVATFTGLTFNTPGAYQLMFTDDGLTPVISAQFSVVAIPAQQRTTFNGGVYSAPAILFQERRNAAVFAAAGPPSGAAAFTEVVDDSVQAAVNNAATPSASPAAANGSGSVDNVLDSGANLRSDDATSAVLGN